MAFAINVTRNFKLIELWKCYLGKTGSLPVSFLMLSSTPLRLSLAFSSSFCKTSTPLTNAILLNGSCVHFLRSSGFGNGIIIYPRTITPILLAPSARKAHVLASYSHGNSGVSRGIKTLSQNKKNPRNILFSQGSFLPVILCSAKCLIDLQAYSIFSKTPLVPLDATTLLFSCYYKEITELNIIQNV